MTSMPPNPAAARRATASTAGYEINDTVEQITRGAEGSGGVTARTS